MGQTKKSSSQDITNSKAISKSPSKSSPFEEPVTKPSKQKDMYDFDDDSDEGESITEFRRSKASVSVMNPLPPPPTSLLQKANLLELKDKENKEMEEKREQEKKDREKKEIEKK